MVPPQSKSAERPSPGSPEDLAQVVERNIHALLARRRAEDKSKGWHDRFADAITRFSGSMTFVYLHLLLFGGWIVVNLPSVAIWQFDPSYVLLAMWASVEAIFLSTFVLITQNRMAEMADQRADLDLQISLLSEHEITRLITLVVAIAEKLHLEQAHQPELAELERDVEPEKVLEAIEKIKRDEEVQ